MADVIEKLVKQLEKAAYNQGAGDQDPYRSDQFYSKGMDKTAAAQAALLNAIADLRGVAEAARELEEALCTTAVGGSAHHELCERRDQARESLRAALARLEGR